LGNETRAHTGPLFNEPIVIGLHARQLKLWISNTPKGFTSEPRHRGVEHGVGDSIGVHCLQTLGRHIGALRRLLPAPRFAPSIAHDGAYSSHAVERRSVSIDNPMVRSVCALHNMWNPVSPLRL